MQYDARVTNYVSRVTGFMKVSYEWLKSFVDSGLNPAKLAHRLTMGGIEVESIEVMGKDTVFELGVTPNRADCLSVIGVARDVAAITNKKLKTAHIAPLRGTGAIRDRLRVTVKNHSRCPRYAARMISGITVGPSPAWLVRRLAAAGIRSINNVVDATNYVMVERGQPLHAFDARYVHGERIVVRLAGSEPLFRTLDGAERRLSPDDLVICDAKRPIALAGIMGGGNSEVADNTTDLVLESAYFQPLGVRRTSKRLSLVSESSRRFERGIDPNGVADALHLLTRIIVDVAGGVPTADWIDIYPRAIRPARISFSSDEVKRVLGIALPHASVRRILASLGFTVAGSARRIVVSVPTFRPDVTRPIDVIEELARVHGYDRIPATMPRIRVRKLTRPKTHAQIDLARRALADAGYAEALLSAFDSVDALNLFHEEEEAPAALIVNPMSNEERAMRTHLIPGLLNAVRINMSRQHKDLKLFALQRVYRQPVGSVRSAEPLRLAGVAVGRRNNLTWRGHDERVDFYDVKGVVEALVANALLSDQLVFQRGGEYGFLVPGRYATVLCANNRVGWVGQLHPETTRRWGIEDEVFAFEIDFESLAARARQVKPRFAELSRYPFVERDLSIIVDATVPHVEIEKTILDSHTKLIADVRLFDVYRGRGIPDDKKSMAYSIRYASDERTLVDDEVNRAHECVVEAVREKLGAQLR